MSGPTVTTFDGLVRDMYPLPGTRLKQWVVDQRREAAWGRETCPLVLTETHDDNTGAPCSNSGAAQWLHLEAHDCCGDCNDLAESTRDRPDVATWLKAKAQRPPVCADRDKLSDEVEPDRMATSMRGSPVFEMLRRPR